MKNNVETIVLGGGCFWCLEAAFVRVVGVVAVVSGYAGGETVNPSYEQVCGGNTGHAEVVQVSYDPQMISLENILHLFFTLHDPTSRNRQGNDVGTEYRSIILYQNEEQKLAAENYLRKLNKAQIYSQVIVTELKALDVFYPAESYHQNYFAKHPDQAYCQLVIAPKLAKLASHYEGYLKEK
jgi:methionine-S-sulfoxide reductase